MAYITLSCKTVTIHTTISFLKPHPTILHHHITSTQTTISLPLNHLISISFSPPHFHHLTSTRSHPPPHFHHLTSTTSLSLSHIHHLTPTISLLLSHIHHLTFTISLPPPLSPPHINHPPFHIHHPPPHTTHSNLDMSIPRIDSFHHFTMEYSY